MKRPYILAALFWVLSILPIASFAQETDDTDPEAPGIQQVISPVLLDGKELFSVRGFSSYTAKQRAAAIANRIREAARDETVTTDSVRIADEADYSSVYAGRHFIMNIYEADAKMDMVQRMTLARLIRLKTAEAIKLYREDRSSQVILRKTVTGLIALALFIILLILLRWLFRKINAGIQNRIRTRIDILENKSFSLIQATKLWKAYHVFFKILWTVFVIILIAAFINYLLGLFPWTSGLEAYLLKILLDPILSFGKGILTLIPDLIFLAVIYLVARYVLKLGKLLFNGIHSGAFEIKGFDHDWAMPTYKIFRILVIAFSLIVAYPYIPGSGSNAFKGISVFMGVLFSLGSSSFISNLIAGYSMTYRRAFKKGDRIQVDNQTGFVEEQEILVTRLRSVKNEEIIIPNSMLLNSNITNFSTRAREGRLILHTTVGIGYETPWRMVDSMLKLAAGRTEGLLKDPPPFVLKLSLGDFAVTYEINAYCNDASKMPQLYSSLHQNILDVFNENNIQIMTPAYEGDPEVPKVVPRNQWDTPLANENEI
jgi:small-conductance mechanosensitive channel